MFEVDITWVDVILIIAAMYVLSHAGSMYRFTKKLLSKMRYWKKDDKY